MEPPATQTTLMEAPAKQTTSDITALCRRHGRHRHPRRNYILHARVPAEAYAQALLKWEGDSSDRQQLMKQILVATHSNGLNAGGRAWPRSSRQSGAIRPHHSPGAGVDGGRRGERLQQRPDISIPAQVVDLQLPPCTRCPDPGVRYPSLARRMSRCSITYLKRDGTPRI